VHKMTTVLYIHGFLGSPTSQKVDALKEKFNVVAPQLSLFPNETYVKLYETINDVLAKDSNLILVGTSLGGFWADYFSREYNLKSVIINPSTNPSESLKQYIGTIIRSGRWSENDCEEFEYYEDIKKKFVSESPRIVLLSRDDDIIDYRIAQKYYEKDSLVKIYEDAGHRFNKYNEIVDAVSEIDNTEI